MESIVTILAVVVSTLLLTVSVELELEFGVEQPISPNSIKTNIKCLNFFILHELLLDVKLVKRIEIYRFFFSLSELQKKEFVESLNPLQTLIIFCYKNLYDSVPLY